MLNIIGRVVLNGIGLMLTAYLVPGIHYSGDIPSLLIAGVVLGLLNLLVKPVVKLFTLPLIILTLGLFYLVLNGGLLWLAAEILADLTVDGCGPAIIGGLILAIFNSVTRVFMKDKDDD